MRIEYQMGFDEVDEEYKAFVDKFKPKKTTDDCYTPPIVYNAILTWCVSEYGIDPKKILRPFYPGGDYAREEYPEEYTVVDNPPFSILSEIVNRYMAAGVPFFLFAPYLTLFSVSSGRKDVCRIITNCQITYDNGAVVNTAFVTNLDRYCVRTVPELSRMVKQANDQNQQETKKRCRYTVTRIRSSHRHCWVGLQSMSLSILKRKSARSSERSTVRSGSGRRCSGGGYLISSRAAAERAAAERAAAEQKNRTVWELSEAEKMAIQALDEVRNE